MTNPTNDRPLTFAKIAEGHWINRETGVAIVRGGDGILRVTEPTQYRMPKYVCSGGREMKVSRRIATLTAARFRERIAKAYDDAVAYTDEQRWTAGAIIDVEAMAHAEDAERSAAGYTPEPIDLDDLRSFLDATRKTSPRGTWADGVACGHGRTRRDCEWCSPVDTFPAANRVTDAATRTDADALRDTANHHQGSRVHAADDQHGRQLRRAGLVGPRGGLTRRGSIAAERLRGDALDAAFGPA